MKTEELLEAYTNGCFPMAESRFDKEIYWFSPKRRGVIPLDTFHVPKSLRKFLRTHPFTITFSKAFPQVIQACADIRTEGRNDTWINNAIIDTYIALWKQGDAHSVEVWKEGVLVGGLYGVSIGGAFFGESMFSRAENASKVALVALVERLRAADYKLLDTQYVNEHLKQFGVQEILREDYLRRLDVALNASPNPSTRFLTASDNSDFTRCAR